MIFRQPAFPAEAAGLPLIVSVNPRARRMSMKICTLTRTLRLTLPPRASRRHAVQWVAEQQPWIERQLATRLPPALPFRPGVALPFGDSTLLLAAGSSRRVVLEGDILHVAGEGSLYAGRVRRWLAAEAVRRFEPPTRAMAARIGKPVDRVTSGDWRSRWGACGRGHIRYSWRLLMAPDFVQQALIAHEVAHLAQPNHGPGFWKLATDLLGAPHRPAREWLAHNAPLLHSYGAES